MTRIGVIGAQGFLGKAVVSELRSRGHTVDSYSSEDGTGLDPVSGLFPSNWELKKETEVVIYLSQSPYYRQPEDNLVHLLNVNTRAPSELALSCKKAKVKKFIYASSGSVYAPSFSALTETSPLRRNDWYVLSKIHAEEYLRMLSEHLAITVLRPFGIFGPGQKNMLVTNLAHRILEVHPISLQGSREDSRESEGLKLSLIFVEDAAKLVAEAAVTSTPFLLNLSSPESLTIRKLSEIIGHKLQRKVVFETSSSHRSGNLIAETTLLNQTLPLQYTKLEPALEETMTYLLRGL